MLFEVGNDLAGVLLGRAFNRFQRNLRIAGRLVGIIHAGKTRDLATTGAGIEAFGIALLAYFDGGIYIHFDETIFANHLATFITCSTIRTDGGANHAAVLADKLASDEANAQDVGVAVFLAEAQAL